MEKQDKNASDGEWDEDIDSEEERMAMNAKAMEGDPESDEEGMRRWDQLSE